MAREDYGLARPLRIDCGEQAVVYTRLLVPLDGSERAEKVFPHAQLLTAAFGKPVLILRSFLPCEG